MLGGRRDLDISVAGGTESVGALLSDGVEVPLEKDSSNVARARWGGIDDRRGHDNEASGNQRYDCIEAGFACHGKGSGAVAESLTLVVVRE